MSFGKSLSVLAMSVGIAGSALAEESFQRVALPGGPIYWDASSIKRNGDNFEVDVLQPYLTGAGAGAPVRGSLTRHRLSCVWNASVGGALGRRTVDAQARVLDKSGAEPFSQSSFYGPHGWQVVVTQAACDPLAVAPKGVGLVQAMADARSILAAKSAPSSDAGRAPDAPAAAAAARFGVVREEKSTGNMSFLDWSRLTRTGDKVSVQVLDVLGDDTPPPPEPQWNYSVIALRTLALDCKSRTLTQTAYVTFTKFLDPGFPDAKPWPVRTAENWPLGAQILDAACSGKEPDKTFPTRAAAIAHQRSQHPLRK